MNESTIKEMWELTEGGEAPEGFMKVVKDFMRHKSAFHPIPFDEGDFAACVLIYHFTVAKAKKGNS